MGGLPGMIKMSWDIITTFAVEVKNAFAKLFTDPETFKNFAIYMGAALDQWIYSTTQFSLKLTAAIGGLFMNLAETIGLILLSPVSVLFSQLKEIFMMFLNWLGPKVYEVGNMVLTPFKWALDKIGIQIGTLDWKPLTEEPALQMADIWPSVWENFGKNAKETLEYAKESFKHFGYEASIAGNLAIQAINKVDPNLTHVSDMIDYKIKKWKEMSGGTGGGGDSKDTAKTASMYDQFIEKTIEMYTHQKILNKTYSDFGKITDKNILWMKEHLKFYEPGSTWWETITTAGEHIETAFKAGWEKYIKEIPTFVEQVSENVGHMALVIEREMGNTFSDFLRTGNLNFKNMWKVMITTAQDSIGDMFAKAIMETVINKAAEWIISLFKEKIWDKLLGAARTMWDGIGGEAKGYAYNNIYTVLAVYKDEIFQPKFNQIVSMAGSMWEGIGNSASGGAYNNIWGVLSAYRDQIFAPKFNQVVSMAGLMWEGIGNSASGGAYNNIWGVLSAYRDQIFAPKFNQVVSMAGSMWEGIGNSASGGAYNNIWGVLSAYRDQIFAPKFNQVVSMAGSMWEGIGNFRIRRSLQ